MTLLSMGATWTKSETLRPFSQFHNGWRLLRDDRMLSRGLGVPAENLISILILIVMSAAPEVSRSSSLTPDIQ